MSCAIRICTLFFVFMVLTTTAYLQSPTWSDSQTGSSTPNSALKVGYEKDGTPLFLCRGVHEGGLHPGKIVAGNCNISYGGAEILLNKYQVLLWKGGVWNSDRNSLFQVGNEKDGTPLFLCRGFYEGGLHPGKIVAGNCNIAYGGNEIVLNNYEVFHGDGYTPPSNPLLCSPKSSHPFGREHTALKQATPGWVRGKACINTNTGELTMVLGLETDSITEGVKGLISVQVLNSNGNIIASCKLNKEIGIGGKSPGKARIEEFSIVKFIPPNVAARAAYLNVDVDFTGTTPIDIKPVLDAAAVILSLF